MPVARSGYIRLVRGLGRDVGEEWLALLRGCADEGLGAVGYYIRFVVGCTRAKTTHFAIVIDLVVVVMGVVRVHEPSVPARRIVRGAGVFVEVLSDESGSVTCGIETRGHVVSLEAVVPVR